MPVRILVTGRPGVGKTTLVSRVVRDLDRPLRGFVTREVRRAGRRVGFMVETFSGGKTWLARTDWKRGPRIGRYRVDVPGFEALVLPELDMTHAPPDTLVVMDEIGPMELLSSAFRDAVLRVFQGPWDVLATVMQRPHPFTDALKAREDVECITLTRNNRDALVPELRARLRMPAP